MSVGTLAAAAARKTRTEPSTLTPRVAVRSREGWMSHARCTTASAPRKTSVRSAVATSAASQEVLGGANDGRRRAIPRISCTSGSAASARRSAQPWLPVAPVTTMRMAPSYPGARPAQPAARRRDSVGAAGLPPEWNRSRRATASGRVRTATQGGDRMCALQTIPVLPVDSLTITTLVDNVTDILLVDEGPARRPPLGSGPRVPAPVLQDRQAFDALRAEHG